MREMSKETPEDLTATFQAVSPQPASSSNSEPCVSP